MHNFMENRMVFSQFPSTVHTNLCSLYTWVSINNGNWTEWSAIWTEIKRVITKSYDREAGVRFVITSLISVQNCTTRSSISTLFYSFWNLKHFCKPETFLFAKDTPPVPSWVLYHSNNKRTRSGFVKFIFKIQISKILCV
jgi:hypothetical protein